MMKVPHFLLLSSTFIFLWSLCNAKKSAINSHFKVVPDYCKKSYEVIRCIQLCRVHLHDDHYDVVKNYKNYAELAVRIMENGGTSVDIERIALDCLHRCETDPLYWTCMEECELQDPTFYWNETCFEKRDTTTGVPPCGTNISEPICQSCLFTVLQAELKRSCEIAYLPGESDPGEPDIVNNLCEKLSDCPSPSFFAPPQSILTAAQYQQQLKDKLMDCTTQSNNPPFTEKMLWRTRRCITDIIMKNQRKCCYSNKIKQLLECNGADCDAKCMSVLPIRVCYAKCELYRSTVITDCYNKTNQEYPSDLSKVCAHCSTDMAEFDAEHQCVEACTTMTCVEACITYGTYNARHMKANCYVGDYLLDLSLSWNVSHMLFHAGLEVTDSNWIVYSNTPLECLAGSSCKEQIMRDWSGAEREAACNTNPFRAIDFLACAIQLGFPSLDRTKLSEDDLDNRFPANGDQCLRDAEEVRLALYKMSYEYEQRIICGHNCTNNSNPLYHPISRQMVIHRGQKCLELGRSPYCPVQEDAYLVQLADFATCRWKVDLAKTADPNVLWGTYFNELEPIEPKSKLEHPDTTTILQRAKYNNKADFFAFPYFVVFRGVCDEGGYYDDAVYRFFMMGARPTIILKYVKPTNRHFPTTYLHGMFEGALVNLKRPAGDDLIPKNERDIDIDIEEKNCHEKICYPAFVVPLILLHISNFKIGVDAQETYSELRGAVYTSPFHARTVEGFGEIQIAAREILAHPAMLFPPNRSTVFSDMELNFHRKCLATKFITTDAELKMAEMCPELEHKLDDFHNPYKKNVFAPLDAEDVFRSQYTFGTAPVQAIAGFYDPRLLILGDADMEKIEVVEWGSLLKDLEYRTDFHSCVDPTFLHGGKPKPIYSRLDKTDRPYPIKHYRQRYAPLRYATEKDAPFEELAETGIFEVIGLQDRLLLVTNKGLVSFYGHSNDTVGRVRDKAWKYFEDEVVNRCFKIVRILPLAQPNVDLIVGITYDYQYTNASTNAVEEVRQEIWIGQFTTAGERIEWSELRYNLLDNIYLEERFLESSKPSGTLLPLSQWRDPAHNAASQEANPRSQIEEICFRAFRKEMKKYSQDIRILEQPGWCDAIDATPVPMKERKIQVLVRIRVMPKEKNEPIFLYIVASHNFGSPGMESEVWTIDSIIPRHPCIHDHREAIRNVFKLDSMFFDMDGRSGNNAAIGCHESGAEYLDNAIYLNGMTYSKSLTSNLFLFGSRLLFSSNQGKNFVFLKSFPQKMVDDDDTAPADKNDARYSYTHRIIQIAFDDSVHYAFLTNKRELWLGTTGDIHQILLRPSPLQTMVQMSISKIKNINDGIPFNIGFDSHDELYEIVAITDNNGTVTRVMKRPVSEWKMLGFKSILENLNARSERLVKLRKKYTNQADIKKALHQSFNYNTARWAAYCPFVSPILVQNFSIINSRTQGMTFPTPNQHLSLGKAQLEETLMAYQVSVFSLIWRTFFHPKPRFYAGFDRDPFRLWSHVKRNEETVRELQYIQASNPADTGILVSPSKHRRQMLEGFHTRLLRHYWLDYHLVVELRLGFSLINDHLIENKDFEADEINNIQLNVENANGTVIQINTEKEVFAHNASVVFIIRMSLKSGVKVQQNLPGENLVPIPITYHLLGAFGKCSNNRIYGVPSDKYDTSVIIGCPTSRTFVFDWNSTLRSIRLRGDRVQGRIVPHGVGDLCNDEEFACFFSRAPMVLHFSIFDESKQVLYPYTGRFIMRVIAGGRIRHRMDRYSEEEIMAYNIPGISDISRIWSEWDPDTRQKVERMIPMDGQPSTKKRDSRETVLRSGKSTISWVCHTLSPCARIRPNKKSEVVFWIRFFVTNRDVENDTLCLFEKEFDIMLYGFPPAPEFQLFATLGSSFLIVGILYALFVCCRSKARVWRRTKFSVKKWVFIVKDAIPKRLRMYELPLGDDKKFIKKSKRRGSEENLSATYNSGSDLEGDEYASHTSDKALSSTSTMGSFSTMTYSDNVIPGGSRSTPSTKEVAYDQILSKRLNSIVERNRTMRQNLLTKASINATTWDLEQEEHFERQFGRTASEESLFTPPLPKDNKGFGVWYK